MSRRRPLSEEERALWHGFTRSIMPLRPSAAPAKDKAATAAAPSSAGDVAPPRAQPRPIAPRGAPPQTAKPLPLAPLGRRLKQRVARGREPIDARVDLHGMTQTEAHAALTRFLRRAQDDGARMVLIVTGKGSRVRDAGVERGVLRRLVPLWLALPEFRTLVIGFEDAHVSHGGQGALYVRLRRGASR
jgi:DNA-nicking Smr family endonuclease